MQTDPRIDTYIARSADFARPILQQIRRLVGETCPAASETIKWHTPFYVLGDRILCATPAFKRHCALIFWHPEMKAVLAQDGLTTAAIRHLTSRKDLPSAAALRRYLKQAVRLATAGKSSRADPTPRPAVRVPSDLASALRKHPPAAATFRKLAPSHRREYIKWITGAKRAETRARRLTQAVSWLADGKRRNWKHERR